MMASKLGRSLLAASLILCTARSEGQQRTPPARAEVRKSSVGPAEHVVLRELSPLPRRAPGAVRVEPAPRTRLSEGEYQTLKGQASRGSKYAIPVGPVPPPSKPPGATPPSPKPTGTPLANLQVFPPISNQELFCGLIPADAAIAANVNFIVQVNNDCITVLSVAGASVAPAASLNNFFGAPAGHDVGDPRALFDPASNRFVVIAADFDANALLVAASQTADPTLGWNHYSFAMGAGLCGDFPMLGQTLQEEGDAKGALYISFNQFTCPVQTGVFSGQSVLVLPKTPVYAGQGFTFWIFSNLAFGGGLVFTVQPANVINAADRPRVEYLENTSDLNGCPPFGGGCNGLGIWAIKDGVPPGAGPPSISGTVIPTRNNYFFPSNATQPGCAGAVAACHLDVLDNAIRSQVTYNSGRLYAAINTNSVVGTTAVLAWEVRPTVNDAGAITGGQILNEVCFACGGFTTPGGSAFFPALQPGPEGNLTMVYNFSSNADFPGEAFLSQRVSQAPGAFRDSGFFLAQGQSFYQRLDTAGRNRWGDYTATAPSYTLPSAYIFSAMFAGANGNWGTAIGRNEFTNPDEP